MSNSDIDLNESRDLFSEAADYYQPDPDPSFTTFDREVDLVNVGYLDRHADQFCRGKAVLELGAGAALPSLLAAVRGASRVVITDYPDPDLLRNIQYNVDQCPGIPQSCVTVEGFIWGNDTSHLAQYCPQNAGFDILILADLVFNHSEHEKLIKACEGFLAKAKDAVAFVFFTAHRPHLIHRDMGFFCLAEIRGFTCEQIVIEFGTPMFEVDKGQEEIRSIVFGYQVKWKRDML